tara:strand:- start:143080 stop:145692 length:2613 start_codon:yes stop_codon:yes gene_type:complete
MKINNLAKGIRAATESAAVPTEKLPYTGEDQISFEGFFGDMFDKLLGKSLKNVKDLKTDVHGKKVLSLINKTIANKKWFEENPAKEFEITNDEFPLAFLFLEADSGKALREFKSFLNKEVYGYIEEVSTKIAKLEDEISSRDGDFEEGTDELRKYVSDSVEKLDKAWGEIKPKEAKFNDGLTIVIEAEKDSNGKSTRNLKVDHTFNKDAVTVKPEQLHAFFVAMSSVASNFNIYAFDVAYGCLDWIQRSTLADELPNAHQGLIDEFGTHDVDFVKVENEIELKKGDKSVFAPLLDKAYNQASVSTEGFFGDLVNAIRGIGKLELDQDDDAHRYGHEFERIFKKTLLNPNWRKDNEGKEVLASTKQFSPAFLLDGDVEKNLNDYYNWVQKFNKVVNNKINSLVALEEEMVKDFDETCKSPWDSNEYGEEKVTFEERWLPKLEKAWNSIPVIKDKYKDIFEIQVIISSKQHSPKINYEAKWLRDVNVKVNGDSIVKFVEGLQKAPLYKDYGYWPWILDPETHLEFSGYWLDSDINIFGKHKDDEGLRVSDVASYFVNVNQNILTGKDIVSMYARPNNTLITLIDRVFNGKDDDEVSTEGFVGDFIIKRLTGGMPANFAEYAIDSTNRPMHRFVKHMENTIFRDAWVEANGKRDVEVTYGQFPFATIIDSDDVVQSFVDYYNTMINGIKPLVKQLDEIIKLEHLITKDVDPLNKASYDKYNKMHQDAFKRLRGISYTYRNRIKVSIEPDYKNRLFKISSKVLEPNKKVLLSPEKIAKFARLGCVNITENYNFILYADLVMRPSYQMIWSVDKSPDPDHGYGAMVSLDFKTSELANKFLWGANGAFVNSNQWDIDDSGLGVGRELITLLEKAFN